MLIGICLKIPASFITLGLIMPGIFGWYGCDIRSDFQNDAVNKMFTAVTDTSDPMKGHLHSDFSLYAYGAGTNFSCCKDSGIYVAIYGEIRLSDNSIIHNIKNDNSAQALIDIFKKAGSGFLNLLGGEFSLVLIDRKNHQIYIVIDKIGIKPFSFTELKNGGVVFGTSLDSTLAHPLVETEINRQAIYNYTYFHVIPSPQTIYSNIYKLEPSHCLIGINNKFSIKKYWSPEFYERHKFDKNLLRNQLLGTLRNIAGRYTITEESGSFLSGGLDSSTVSGILSECYEQPLNSFSIGFSEDGYDEITYARTAANHFGLNLHEYYITPTDIIDSLPVVAKAYDEPFGNSSAIPTYVCAKFAASSGIKTMYAGDGGDEIFAGNDRYATQKIFSYYDLLPRILRENVVEPMFSNSLADRTFITRKISRYIEQARLPMPERMQSYNFLNMVNPSSIFHSDFLENVDIRFPIHLLNKTYQDTSANSMLNKMLYLDWKFTLADNDLRKVNRMCELADINVQYPMLDDELIEFSNKIPPNLKLKGLNLRYFFKDALNGFLPERIINKPKHGFGLPFGEWLKTSSQLQDIVYDSLNNLARRNIYSKVFINDLISKHREGHASYYGTMVWVLSMLEQWFYYHEK